MGDLFSVYKYLCKSRSMRVKDKLRTGIGGQN